MTKVQATQNLSKHWGTALAAASALIYYSLAAYGVSVPDEAKVTAIMGGVLGLAQWLRQANKIDTGKEVEKTLTYETLLASLGIKERFAELEATQEKHHEENSKRLAAIATRDKENDRLHAEHIAVTDSHGVAIDALSDAVKEVVPAFQAPLLVKRAGAP